MSSFYSQSWAGVRKSLGRAGGGRAEGGQGLTQTDLAAASEDEDEKATPIQVKATPSK